MGLVVVSFGTSAEAFAFQKAACAAAVPGKLAMIPRSLSAGCGMSWQAPEEDLHAIRELIASANLEFEEVHVIQR